MILYPSRGFIVQNGVPRTRTCRRGAGSSSSRSGTRSRSLVGASAKPRCRQREKTVWMGYRSVVCGPAIFFSSIGMQAEAGQRVSGRREAEEQQSAREMGEVWKRLRNRTPADNSRRNLICRSVNQISREMRASETDPVLDNSPYGKSVTADALTESYGFGGEWKNSVWITIILKTSLILRENLKLGEITLSDILDHCLITKYRASIFIYI